MTELLEKQDVTDVLRRLGIEQDKLNHYMNLFSLWIASQKHLPQNLSETCRKKFLLWAKLDFEKAKKKFQNFCYNPMTHGEFCCDRALTFQDDIRKASEYVCAIPMPKLTPQAVRVTCVKFLNGDNFDALLMGRLLTMQLEFRIRIDDVVAGEIAVVNFECMKPHHYAKLFTPTYFKLIKFAMVNYPFLIKNIFVINCHPFLEKGINVVKAIIPQKIADRVKILSDPKELNKHIPLECLPEDYGGTEKSLDQFQTLWKRYWLSIKDFCEELDRCRPTGPIPEEFKRYESEFGVDGSFRKLNID
ncbi:hypothetical protein Trydic_g23263 [Trypoxylus dichotomus]